MSCYAFASHWSCKCCISFLEGCVFSKGNLPENVAKVGSPQLAEADKLFLWKMTGGNKARQIRLFSLSLQITLRGNFNCPQAKSTFSKRFLWKYCQSYGLISPCFPSSSCSSGGTFFWGSTTKRVAQATAPFLLCRILKNKERRPCPLRATKGLEQGNTALTRRKNTCEAWGASMVSGLLRWILFTAFQRNDAWHADKALSAPDECHFTLSTAAFHSVVMILAQDVTYPYSCESSFVLIRSTFPLENCTRREWRH